MTHFEQRHAISRARFFLKTALGCHSSDREGFEANLEASIVFARTALQRLRPEYGKHPKWKDWFEDLLANPSVRFFMEQRNHILKQGPPKIGQILHVGERPEMASDCYYYEDPGTPATSTVERHLTEITRLVEEAESLFT